MNDEDGNPWDFRLREQREKASKRIDEMQPDLLIGSPMCGLFSNSRQLNMRTPEGLATVQRKEAEGEEHLEFCAKGYKAQMERGGIFLHPQTARSWKRPCMEELVARDDVFLVTGDRCMYGLISEDEFGPGAARSRQLS